MKNYKEYVINPLMVLIKGTHLEVLILNYLKD
jgi:hypothetical protein